MVCLALVLQPAWAQQPGSAKKVPAEPSDMTMAQLQGLACIGAGALGSLVAYAYTDALLVTGAVVNPLIIVAPAIATGFAFGCSIGGNIAPGLFWMHAKLQ